MGGHMEELTLLRLAELYARVNTCDWDPLLGSEPTDRKKKINETCRACKELVDTVGPDVTELLRELHRGGNLNSWLKKRWYSRKMRKMKSFKAELIEVVVSTVVAVITAVLTVWLIKMR